MSPGQREERNTVVLDAQRSAEVSAPHLPSWITRDLGTAALQRYRSAVALTPYNAGSPPEHTWLRATQKYFAKDKHSLSKTVIKFLSPAQ